MARLSVNNILRPYNINILILTYDIGAITIIHKYERRRRAHIIVMVAEDERSRPC